mmetsp:Transcript_14150/g.32111  ORF Transcript_14150/g.32111 Transcript_14150/m.32111 type:complete len:116 (-) Transcript_14150:290-637(-)
MYRPIVTPPSPTLHHVLSLVGFRSAFRAKTRFVDGFRDETNPPRNQVSSAAHRDMKRRIMPLLYDFIWLQTTVEVLISTLFSVICIQVTQLDRYCSVQSPTLYTTISTDCRVVVR